MKRQMFNQGGYVHPQRMNLGGQPMMPPAAPPQMAPPQMGPEQALAGAEAQGQEMGMMAAEGVMQQIDGAQDYQSLIDGIRGNQQPLEARYAELGGIVGEQDAMQTPESVLALTQPAIMMTEEGAVNSGIGELMQGIAGDTSMEGQMGEGVGGLMMAQAPEPAMQAPMMEAGNTPPVNFRQGGPVEVRGYQAGTEVKVGGGQSLNPVIAQANRDASAYQDYFAGAMDSEARAADLEEQRKMSQAQMLFDIAQAGLQFAGTTEGGSIAERLANAAAQTQLPQRIGERAAGMMAAKREQRAEDRQIRMAGLQASLEDARVKTAADRAEAAAKAKRQTPKMVNVVGEDGVLIKSIDVANQYPEYQQLLLDNPGATAYNLGTKQAANIEFVHTFKDGKFVKSTPFDVNNNSEKAAFLKAVGEAGNFDEAAAKPMFAAITEANKLNLTGLPMTFYKAKGDFRIDEGTSNARMVKEGQLVPLTQVQFNKHSDKVDPMGDKPTLVPLYKYGAPDVTMVLEAGTDVEALLSKYPGYALEKPNFEQVTFTKFSADGTGKLIGRENVNLGTPEGEQRAAQLSAEGYTADDEAANIYLREVIADRARAADFTNTLEIWNKDRETALEDIKNAIAEKVKTEERAVVTQKDKEKRQEIIWDRQQAELEKLAVLAFNRSNDAKISAVEKKVASDLQVALEEEARQIERERREAARTFKTQMLTRRYQAADGTVSYEQVEMPLGTAERTQAVFDLLEAEAEVGYSKWGTDKAAVEAWREQQVSIANLFRQREGEFTEVKLTEPVKVNGRQYSAGIQQINKNDFMAIQKRYPKVLTKDYVSTRDIYQKTGFTPAELLELTEDQLKYVRGLPSFTDADRERAYIQKFGMGFEEFDALLPWQKEQKLGLAVPAVNYINLVNPNDSTDIRTIDVSIPTNRAIVQELITKERFVETGQFSIPVTEKTTGFVTQRAITVEGTEVPANTFVELNPTQVAALSPDAIRRPLQGAPKTLLKDRKTGDTEIVTLIGGNFYDAAGKPINLASSEYADAVLLSDNGAYEEALTAKKRAAAVQQRDAFQRAMYREYFNVNLTNLTEAMIADREKGNPGVANSSFAELRGGQGPISMGNVAASTIDIADQILKGTGPYAKLKTFANSVGAILPENFGWSDMFQEEATASNWVDVLNISIRVALASSPRLAEAEQARLGRGLPDSQKFLANPRTELAKAVALRTRLNMEYEQNLNIIAEDPNSTLAKKAREQNHAIGMYNSLLGGIPLRGYVDDAEVNALNKKLGISTKKIGVVK